MRPKPVKYNVWIRKRKKKGHTPQCNNWFAFFAKVTGTVEDALLPQEMNPILFEHLLDTVYGYTRHVVPEWTMG